MRVCADGGCPNITIMTARNAALIKKAEQYASIAKTKAQLEYGTDASNYRIREGEFLGYKGTELQFEAIIDGETYIITQYYRIVKDQAITILQSHKKGQEKQAAELLKAFSNYQ